MADEKKYDIVGDRNQPTLGILKKGLQMTQLISSLKLSFYREMPEI
jgi:hypothetical protein